jgi:hypothetical protein
LLWSPNLQLLYPFENQANDYSGNARHGTVNGSGVYATKPNGGRCLYFDGTGDYVNTPAFGLSGTVVWFAADVRCKNYVGIQVIFGEPSVGYSGHFALWRPENSTTLNWEYDFVTGYAQAASASYFDSPYEDVWLHLMVVCDYAGKNTYFYRNGTLVQTSAMSGTPVFPSTVRVKYIGSYDTTWFMLSNAYLQNVQLWTLATMPPVAQVTANANRIMLGLHPLW